MFTDTERHALLRIAEAATPPGRHVPSPTTDTIRAAEKLLRGYGEGAVKGYRAMLWTLERASVPLSGSKLSGLELEERERMIVRLANAETSAWLVRAVTAPLKVVQSQANGLEAALGAHDGRKLTIARERERHEARVVDGRSLHADETIEVDCVVVGTGAGGPPVAKALAARGHAVVMLETGSYFTRSDFSGRPIDLQQKMYWNGGATVSYGNTMIFVPMGKTVGGSTTINSGTCYRTPEATMRRWQLEHGLHDLRPGSLDEHFDRVETVLEVERAKPETLGGCARVIARGCDALGWRHEPLTRNAPGCDGQGVCCFGCPTDAKRSSNVSYVPQALNAGAMLYTNTLVTQVIVEGGRAVGVVAKVGGNNGHSRTLTVRAKSVVMACGTVQTAGLLLKQGLANSSGQLGKNLTIHPTGYAWAAFDEAIGGFDAIPQGYAVEEFSDLGIRFEGVFVPISLAAGTMGQVGRRWTDMIERLDQLACFGFMLAETSRGRVVLGPGGTPQMTYVLNDEDVRRMVKAYGLLARIYHAAGAHAVYPGVLGYDELKGMTDIERLEHEGAEKVRAHHMDLSAYHPLGTCRMGADARSSVIGPTQETWDVPGLFVCDGSAVPGPLGVNPQVTIMALSERAAQFVEQRIERGTKPAAKLGAGARVEFKETMAGMLAFEPAEGGGSKDVSFTVKVTGVASLLDAFRAEGGSWELEGTLTAAGIATARPCQGTLVMRPRQRKGTLVYDLAFEDDDGNPCSLHGEKHTGVLGPLKGMTTLYTELRRGTTLLGRGILSFDLKDLKPWLKSWKLSKSAAAS